MLICEYEFVKTRALQKTFLILSITGLAVWLHGDINFKNNKAPGISIAHADGAVENLDEMVLRKDRFGSRQWGASLLENASDNYTWQPETLNYQDAFTDNEVWKITNTPTGVGGGTQDISTTHWSGNGEKLLIHSGRSTASFFVRGYVNHNGVSYKAIAGGNATVENEPPNATYWQQINYDPNYTAWSVGQYYESPVKIWMLINTDGGELMSARNSSNRSVNWSSYAAWNPAKSGEFLAGGGVMSEGTQTNSIYRNVVEENGTITKTSILTTEDPTGRLYVKKSMAPDGSKVYFYDSNSGKAYVGQLNGVPSLDTPSGYSRELPFDYFWGQAPTSWNGYHDEFLAGSANGIDGLWHYIMPESANGPWWRAKVVGSGANGQPVHIQDHSAPYSWGGELEPVNTRLVNHEGVDPWGLTQYPSHFTPDRWGHYAIFSKVSEYPYGASLLNFRTHDYWNPYPNNAWNGGRSVQHHDWEAWSDWSVSSSYDGGNYLSQSVMTQNYKDVASQKVLASAHTRYNDGGIAGPYESIARPTQSPDGTKAMFNSTFLNVNNYDIQLFWTVAYNPYPPQIKSATKVSNNVRLVWDFNQGSNCLNSSQTTPRTSPTPNFTDPRTYATRGWPHETLDCPPSPREIKNFRIWSSTDNNTWTPIGTTTYNNCTQDNECGMWTETSWNFDAAQPNNTTRYYAITSLEHSGLESKTLSNVWKVVTDGSGNITEQVQQENYPADPGAKSNFFTTNPDAPQDITATHKLSPATADGQYTLTWTAPTNHDLIRYYNIYAEDGSEPTAIQQNRIASIAATSDYDADNNFSYVDWLGNTDGSTQYKITAVDYQGNESGVMDAVAPGAPSGLNVE